MNSSSADFHAEKVFHNEHFCLSHSHPHTLFISVQILIFPHSKLLSLFEHHHIKFPFFGGSWRRKINSKIFAPLHKLFQVHSNRVCRTNLLILSFLQLPHIAFSPCKYCIMMMMMMMAWKTRTIMLFQYLIMVLYFHFISVKRSDSGWCCESEPARRRWILARSIRHRLEIKSSYKRQSHTGLCSCLHVDDNNDAADGRWNTKSVSWSSCLESAKLN